MTRPTLPGIIPGLLRRGSPVVRDDGMAAVVLHVYDHDHHVLLCSSGADDPERFACATDSVALDLTDPTGRAHAAWWLAARGSYYVPARRSFDDLTDEAWITIWRRIGDGSDLADVQIDALRRVVLAVAGLEEPVESAVVVGEVSDAR